MFIKRENAIKAIDAYAQALYAEDYHDMGKAVDTCSVMLEDIKMENVVPAHEYYKLNFQCNVLKALLNGEWVNCEDVQETLNITFEQGMQMFKLGRMATWNSYPENGQRIVTKFKISENTLRNTKYTFEDSYNIVEHPVVSESAPTNNHLELLLEQQGGII